MRLKKLLKSCKLTLSIVGSAALLGVTAILPPAAQAGAIKCVPSGGFAIPVPQIGSISSFYICLEVGGKGLNVTDFAAYAVGPALAPIPMPCNYQYKVRWYDLNNNNYATATGPIISGCSTNRAFARRYRNGIPRKQGQVCAELYESGARRQGVPCVAIFP